MLQKFYSKRAICSGITVKYQNNVTTMSLILIGRPCLKSELIAPNVSVNFFKALNQITFAPQKGTYSATYFIRFCLISVEKEQYCIYKNKS